MISPDQLRTNVHFSQFTLDELRRLAELGEEQVVPPETVVFSEYDPADKMYLILSGELNLQYTLGDGQQRVVDTLVDGELAVWSALVEPYRCTATGKTTKETRLAAFDAHKLRQLCESDHALGTKLLAEVVRLLSNRLQNARTQLAAL